MYCNANNRHDVLLIPTDFITNVVLRIASRNTNLTGAQQLNISMNA